MSTKILACETLRDELLHAAALSGRFYEIIWIESGLHNYPEKLRSRMQEELDNFEDCERILLVFGCCGGAATGLTTGNFELVIPRVDDCISILIGSVSRRLSYKGVYFLTPGWLRGERNLWAEYNYTVEKYGEKRANRIIKVMLEHYTTLGLLDAPCYDMEALARETEGMAEKLELERLTIPASVDYLKALLEGPWDNERFITVPPHSVIEDFPLFL